ncbi:hypothetical protein KIW84_051375 [Lathyrus oleraceus]|uniref:Uncharacterized protein n=1 Tax=Pisum sativum TaxID=3888 RepID=A0A9D4WLX7_PEA|nr:hypothetical protein KIW84_051375 [Pisum sativum]
MESTMCLLGQSILQDCNKEVFNTAKVDAQTNVYVKKLSKELGNSLIWTWASDPVEDTLQAIGTFNASQLLEQKSVTVDASDYLWYMTKWGTYDNLRFTYEKIVSLKQGTNIISLLSGTVGHAHYGASFDMKETGIVGGPVKLIATSSGNTMDLSKSSWSYKVGLNGEARRFYDSKIKNGVQWNINNVVIGKPLTWYKTTFKTPEAEKNGCDIKCDYRGNYGADKCLSGCGEPSQRFYHVPRSFLNNDTKSNTLVCCEEMGGSPFNVSVQTVAIDFICARTDYGKP